MEINNYPDYLIYEDGRVYSKKTKRFLKPLNNNRGYLHVSLCNKGKRKTLRIHRLVAEHYIPNPHNKKEVDHIDRNRLNNHVSNLRWATHSENNQNTGKRCNNKSGIKNISYCKSNNRWIYTKIYRGVRYHKYFKSKIDCLCYKYIHTLKIKCGLIA